MIESVLLGAVIFLFLAGMLISFLAAERNRRVEWSKARHEYALKRIERLETELLDDARTRPWEQWPRFPDDLSR